MDDPAEKSEAQVPDAAPPAGVGQPGSTGRQTPGSTGGQRWDGGIGKNRRGHLATIPVMVRWDSAAIVRDALATEKDPNASALPAAATGNYIITVTGLLPAKPENEPATLQAKSSSEESNQPQTPEELLEWFMVNTRLLVKGEPQMLPQNVQVDPHTGAVHVFFKRSDGFAARKRDMLFVTRYGTMNVQTRFRQKDMLVDGKPDL